MKNTFLSICEKSCYICDQSQYAEASAVDKFKLRIHLLFCKSCQAYSKKNTALTNAIKKSKVKCICTKDKQELQKKINSEIQKEGSNK
ncbi:hypothetical protein NBRC110019_23390 [Neptunitalea chrysea]|uniref:Glycine dehydrogenase n=1 Tax=Neptunitalea chrysea TaxID=1647581 RepID=A0A9W6B616_9FLAO|nr:glycine dehydrogenase [Neptunitalea chrysea]GLB53298.1 hypothetical protein NBRC110019_23390 [Neptunitalea chrysea]